MRRISFIPLYYSSLPYRPLSFSFCPHHIISTSSLLLTHRLCSSSSHNTNNNNTNINSNSGRVPGKVRVHVTTASAGPRTFAAPAGVSLMVALRDVGRVEVEAACDGTCACSTCHVILGAEAFKRAGPITEDEADMLDLAPGLTPTSRLSCQVTLTEELDGITVRMPEETSNQLS